MILAPVRRLTTSIVDFGGRPERAPAHHRALARLARDRPGRARARSDAGGAGAARSRSRSTSRTLGLAVAKINHDMRNMLSAAQILSDRLATTTDPLAQRLAPKLVATLDRAIRFCQATLTYGRAADAPPRPRLLALRAVVAEAAETAALPVVHGARRDPQRRAGRLRRDGGRRAHVPHPHEPPAQRRGGAGAGGAGARPSASGRASRARHDRPTR